MAKDKRIRETIERKAVSIYGISCNKIIQKSLVAKNNSKQY